MRKQGERYLTLVSIHAPAQGATLPPQEIITSYKVSIHAPAQGATKLGIEIGGN